MTIITSIGREPGYPQTTVTIKDSESTTKHTDRHKIIASGDSYLSEDIIGALPTYYRSGPPLGMPASDTSLESYSLSRDKEARVLWFLDQSYVTLDAEQEEDNNKPPDQRKPKWNWSYESFQHVLRKDADSGGYVVNSAYEPFELVTEIPLPILTIERWQLALSPDAIINYVNHRNQNVFWTAPAGAVVCVGVRDREDSEMVYQRIRYRKVGYTFKFYVPYIEDVLEGSTEIVADVGTRYWNAATSKYISIDELGHGRTFKLNTDGSKLSDSSGTLLFKRFEKYKKANFNDLGLNNTQIGA